MIDRLRSILRTFGFFMGIILLVNFAGANTYLSDIYFTIPNSVFTTGERIELVGYLYQANYTDGGTLVTSSSPLPSALVNLTIKNSTAKI